MESSGKRPSFRVDYLRELGEQGEGRAHVGFVEDGELSLVIHLQAWQTDQGTEEWRNYGFTYEARLNADEERDAVTPEALQRLVDSYPYWLSLARATAERPFEAKADRTLKRSKWKPAQPGRSPTFLAEIADEFVRRFDAGENAVTAIARAHGVAPGTVSKWLTKAADERVDERRASRYRRRR